MKMETGELFRRDFQCWYYQWQKNIEDIMVIDKLIKSKIPIEDVPWWLETANVLKEDIVVIALKKIAEGVLLLTTDCTLLSSIYLLRKYTG